MTINFVPRQGKRKASALPLFNWADAQSLASQNMPIERSLERRYRLKPSRARLIAGLAGLGVRRP